MSVLSNIQQAYQTSNAPPASAATPGNTTAAASPASSAQLASYNLALSLLGTSSSNALNNIATIVAGGTASNTSSSTGSNASLTSLF